MTLALPIKEEIECEAIMEGERYAELISEGEITREAAIEALHKEAARMCRSYDAPELMQFYIDTALEQF